VTAVAQPPVPAERLAAAAGALLRYRIMAFVTGVVLISGCIALILKASGVRHMEPGTGLLWVAHGYLYLVYVICTGALGVKLRWPLPRYALVMLAGTVPASFIAEHFVTRAARSAPTRSGRGADPPPSM
jgi:integral membrane protein